MSSITLGRPLALQDFEVDLSPPLDIDDASLDHWNLTGGPPPPPSSTLTVISGMNCVAALYQIMGKVFSTIFTTRTGTTTIAAVSEKVAELDSLLNAWIGTIPAHLVWSVARTRSWTALISNQELKSAGPTLARAERCHLLILLLHSNSHPPRLHLSSHGSWRIPLACNLRVRNPRLSTSLTCPTETLLARHRMFSIW